MTEPIAKTSPLLTARVAGLFYLLVFVTGGIGLFAGGGLVVPGDAAATAANLQAHESSFRFLSAANLLATASYIAVTALFYVLFKPVDKTISLVAAFFSLVGCAVGAVSSALQLAALVILGKAGSASPFTPEHLQVMASIALKVSGQCNGIALVFFGFYCLLIGCLVLRSTFLPRALGALMVLAGFGWLTFLWPPLASALSPYNLAPGILGEGALTLWLLVAGVNVPRWLEKAAAAS